MGTSNSGDSQARFDIPKDWEATQPKRSKRMSKSRGVRNIPRKSCECKRRYRDYEEAKRARRIIENHNRRDVLERRKVDVVQMRIYRCPKCKGFHLTSKPEYGSEVAA